MRKHKGFDFPQDPYEQLKLATEAVFKSWNGKPAIAYRNREKIPHDLGTGVNIVTMVFGNMGWTSGTGVAFTRNPATGEKKLYGDYLMNAQGEDVVAGIRNTKPIAEMEQDMPEVYAQFNNICDRLEKHYREMQDVEFTIEQGKLWMLQTRNGKRTAKAAIKIAVDMNDEALITQEEAIQRVTPENVDALLHPQFDPKAKRMTVSLRIDGPAEEEAALRVMDEAVDFRQPDVLLFDLADQETITSSVLGAFVKYHRRGIEVHLLDPSEPILNVLTHTMLIQFFHVLHRLRD